ncbi:MAG TPA: MarC family protein [Membranihabitans sp.]|nr:MarC family protein [Membranihabitans sp.]
MDFGNLIGFAMTVFLGLFAIMNPIANLPAFIGMTQSLSSAERKNISRRASLTAFFIVATFVILGKTIFSLFGLTIPAFKITGGILIFIAGYDMIRSREGKKKENEGMDDVEAGTNIAISPLATPLMAGPGSIVTAMTFVSDRTWIYFIIVLLMVAAVCFIHFIAFSMSEIIVRRLGKNIIPVIGKMMGLIIAVIGTGMIISGVEVVLRTFHLIPE